MDDAAPQPESVEIPNKLYFRIGEVSSMLGLEPHVLRFWESEFGALSPKKSGTGHRLYRRKDVELLLRIKHLLYEKRYTIEGAKQMLQEGQKRLGLQKVKPVRQQGLFTEDPIPEIRRELAAILEILK